MTLDWSGYGLRKDFRLADYYTKQARVDRGEVCRHKATQKMVLDSLEANFRPTGLLRRIGSKEDRQIILLDCTDLNDPDEDPNDRLADHKGTHWQTMEEIADSSRLIWATEELNRLEYRRDHLIVCICRKGKHRSVAVAEFVLKALADYWYRGRYKGNCALLHLQQITHWKNLCVRNGAPDPRCPTCYLYQPNNIFDSHKSILERGAKKLERYFLDDQQWDRSFEKTAYDDRQEAYWQEWKSRGRQAQREEADKPDSHSQTPASSCLLYTSDAADE